MKSTPIFLFISILGLTLACSHEQPVSSETAPAPSPGLPVDVKVVHYAPHIQEEQIAGSILSNREVQLTSELSRKVIARHFTEGTFVKAGQKLFSLDARETRARLKQIDAELQLAKITETRLAALLAKDAVRQEEYDIALSKLQSLEASRSLLETELTKTEITAPFAGIVGISPVHPGALVSPGTSLVTLQEQHVVKIEFTVSEQHHAFVKKGKKIYFLINGSNERKSAVISASESGVDPNSRTITVHALADNQNGKLKPGMSARIFFSTTEQHAKALTIPTEALIPGGKGYQVFIVKNGSAKSTAVQIGNRSEHEALITAGLADGDTVLISNILRAGDGTPVQIISAAH